MPRGVAPRPPRVHRGRRPGAHVGPAVCRRIRELDDGGRHVPHATRRTDRGPLWFRRTARHARRGSLGLGTPADAVDRRGPETRQRSGVGPRAREPTRQGPAARSQQPADQPRLDLRRDQPALSADAEPEALQERRGLRPDRVGVDAGGRAGRRAGDSTGAAPRRRQVAQPRPHPAGADKPTDIVRSTMPSSPN